MSRVSATPRNRSLKNQPVCTTLTLPTVSSSALMSTKTIALSGRSCRTAGQMIQTSSEVTVCVVCETSRFATHSSSILVFFYMYFARYKVALKLRYLFRYSGTILYINKASTLLNLKCHPSFRLIFQRRGLGVSLQIIVKNVATTWAVKRVS